MNAKSFCFKVVLAALPFLPCEGLPTYYGPPPSTSPNRPPPSPNRGTDEMRQLRTSLSDLKHEVSNHEAEIRTFESTLHTQEIIIDNLRQELSQNLQEQQNSAHAQNVHLESKIDTLDQAVKGLVADIKQLKTQSNDFVTVFSQYKQKLSEIEKVIDAQNQHMQNYESTLQSIVAVLQAKEATQKATAKVSEFSRTHKVQTGENLERIARSYNVSVQSLRSLNGLNHDRIVPGQTLKIP